jgi:hypothetical protein
MPYAKGKADIRTAEDRIRQIEAELADAGRVLSLPPAYVVKAACDEITAVENEPQTYEERRPILESLIDLKLYYAKGHLVITGKVPVPSDAALAGGGKRNRYRVNTAIFSVIDAVLPRPLPYPDPRRLTMIWETFAKRRQFHNVVSPADYLEWQAQSTVFEQVAAIDSAVNDLTGVSEPEEIRGQYATANLFPLLGVAPELGRVFTTEEASAEAHVIVLSRRLWERRFGLDPNILGRTMEMDRKPLTIIGVMPAGFERLDSAAQFWRPFHLDPHRDFRARDGRYLGVVARLKPGVPLAEAQSQLTGIAERLERAYPAFSKGWGARITTAADEVSGDYPRRSTSCWVRWRWCSSSRAPMWPTCCSRAVWRATGSSPFAPPLAQHGGASRDSCLPNACCSRRREAAAESCSPLPFMPRCGAPRRHPWPASPMPEWTAACWRSARQCRCCPFSYSVSLQLCPVPAAAPPTVYRSEAEPAGRPPEAAACRSFW